MKKILLLSLAILPLSCFAETEWINGQFEVNAIFGQTDSKLGNANSYGASVAGGYYVGDHLFQIEVGMLISENLGGGINLVSDTSTTPTRFGIQTYTRTELQDIPVWFNYRYGVSFGPGDMFRLEAGPLVGPRVTTFRSKYDISIIQSGQPTLTYNDRNEQDGHLVFDYGAAATLRCRITEHWSLHAGYRYVRTTGANFKSDLSEFNTATATYTQAMKLPEHGTQYASLGVEYRF